MGEVARHSNIKLITYAEVEDVKGYVGNFEVTIRKKAKYVDWDRCTGCGHCIEICPTKVPDEFNCGLSQRKAIYIQFPQAVPKKAIIDAEIVFISGLKGKLEKQYVKFVIKEYLLKE